MSPDLKAALNNPAEHQALVWEDQLTAGGAVSSFLTCVAAPFSTSHKVFGWTLFVLSAAMLLAIAIIRVTHGTKLKLRFILPMVSAMFVVCLIAVGFTGWTLLHPPAAPPESKADSEKPAAPAPAAPVEYKIKTSGDNAPIVTGNQSSVTINNSNEKQKTRK